MSALLVLIGCSIPIALGFLIAFLISAKSGQFDDSYTPSIRILTDDNLALKEDHSSEITCESHQTHSE